MNPEIKKAAFFFINIPPGRLKITLNGDQILSIGFTGEQHDHSENVSDESQPLIKEIKKQFEEYSTGRRMAFSLPLSLGGTSFQQRVWKELQRIPFGKTITYAQLALRLGDPKCIRAAAAANGKNPFAIVVPCHRVIGSDGSLTGYAGGIDKKRWLLEHENSFANGLQFLF